MANIMVKWKIKLLLQKLNAKKTCVYSNAEKGSAKPFIQLEIKFANVKYLNKIELKNEHI